MVRHSEVRKVSLLQAKAEKEVIGAPVTADFWRSLLELVLLRQLSMGFSLESLLRPALDSFNTGRQADPQ